MILISVLHQLSRLQNNFCFVYISNIQEENQKWYIGRSKRLAIPKNSLPIKVAQHDRWISFIRSAYIRCRISEQSRETVRSFCIQMCILCTIFIKLVGTKCKDSHLVHTSMERVIIYCWMSIITEFVRSFNRLERTNFSFFVGKYFSLAKIVPDFRDCIVLLIAKSIYSG